MTTVDLRQSMVEPINFSNREIEKMKTAILVIIEVSVMLVALTGFLLGY